MTAKTTTWAKEAEFHPSPVDWFRQPKLKRFRKAHEANAGRWFYLVAIATQSRANGLLLAADRTPFQVEDFAEEFGGSVESWKEALNLCQSLGLLGQAETPHGRAWEVLPWSTWNRDAAKEAAKDEDSYRKRLERECKNLKAENAKLKESVHAEGGRVQVENGRVHPVQLRQDQTREEEKREDQTDKTRREKMDALRAKLCLSDFSEEDFLEEANRVHQRLNGRPLSKRNRESLSEDARQWEDASWGDRAGALLIAAQMTSAREKQGKVDKNPWFYAVRAAPSFLADANNINAANRVALEVNDPEEMPLVPMRWVGDSS